MTAARLGLVELDLLATHAGASIPFPLRVPSFGRIAAERDELFAAAGATLRMRHLADEDGPIGLAADLAGSLAGHRGTVDLVITGPGRPMGAVAILRGRHALLCSQILDEEEPLVDVRRVPLEGVAEALAGLIPDLPGAKTMPIRVPAGALRAIRDLAAAGETNLEYRLRAVAAEHGGQVDDLEALFAACREVTGGGQLGATRVSGQGRDARTGTELSWLDGPQGRLRVALPPNGDGWVSINPLRPGDLHAALRDLVDLAS